MTNARHVLVVGATGLLGSHIVERIKATGDRPVRAFARTTSGPERLQQLAQLTDKVMYGDLKQRSSLVPACQDVDVIVSTASSTLSRQPGDSITTVDEEGHLALIDAAEAAGVKRFVFISFPPYPFDFALQRAKRRIEARLLESPMTTTILQPLYFSEVWLSPALGFDPVAGKVSILGKGNQPVSWISVRDVARFAVAAVEDDAPADRTLPLGGPDALSPLEVVDIFRELGAPEMELQHTPEEELERRLKDAKEPLDEAFAAIMLGVARGYVIDSRPALQMLPGRLSTVREHAARVLA